MFQSFGNLPVAFSGDVGEYEREAGPQTKKGAFDRVSSLYAVNGAIPANSILLFGRVVSCRRGRAQASHSPLWNLRTLVRCLNSAYRDCHSGSPAITRPSSVSYLSCRQHCPFLTPAHSTFLLLIRAWKAWQSWGQGFEPPQLHQKTKGVTGHPVTPLCVGRPSADAAAPPVTSASG